MPSPVSMQHNALAAARVFNRSSSDWTIMFLIIGVFCIIAAGVGFVVALKTDVGLFRLQAMTLLPVLVGLAFIGKALQGRSQLVSVALDTTGITLINRNGSQHLSWGQVAWNAESLQPLSYVARCTLYGVDGRMLARIPAVVDQFNDLIALINQHVKTQPNAQAEHVRRARLRRQSPLVFGFGLVMLAIVGFLLWTEIQDHRSSRLLAGESVEGLATIERKFVAPDGRTKRVEYRVDARRKDGSRPDPVNVELEPSIWESLREGSKFPVTFVPADPDVSRLAMSQRDDGLKLGMMPKILLFGGGSVFAIFCLVMGTMNWFGIDIVLDSQTKKIRIARSVSK